MKVKIWADYDAIKNELLIENSNGFEWKFTTQKPEIVLASIIGASFANVFENYFQQNEKTELKFQLTFEQL